MSKIERQRRWLNSSKWASSRRAYRSRRRHALNAAERRNKIVPACRRYAMTLAACLYGIALQGNRCAIGGASTPQRKAWVWPLGHDHPTVRARAFLCHLSNRGRGMFKDVPRLLAAAERYLVQHVREAEVEVSS